LFDTLLAYDEHFTLRPALAEEVTPNSVGDQWTVRLRKGVEWHNGKSLTADDVLFTMSYVANPKHAAGGLTLVQAMDIKHLAKLDEHTLRFYLGKPFSVFPDYLQGVGLIAPVGYDRKNPVGTGAFKVKSFTPGQQSVFDRFPNWWGSAIHPGAPHVDQLVIIDLNDDAARVNALLAGQVDGIAGVPYAQVPIIQRTSGQQLLTATGGSWRPFIMRMDLAPFNDVRVRQAFRLLVDRPQMLANAISGHGQIGNDLYGVTDADYNHSIPQRSQDITQARALLKAAGREGLVVTLTTSEVQPGVIEASQILAQQAKAAGVTINLNKVPPGTLFGNQFLHWPFAVDWYPPRSYLQNAGLEDSNPTAVFNETHQNIPEYTKLYEEALATLDPAKRREICHEMQQISWNQGGYIIPYFADNLDAHSTKVTGFVQNDKRGYPFNSYEFWRASLV
jgi:peptide/nickel transport system substrate-binding protein